MRRRPSSRCNKRIDCLWLWHQTVTAQRSAGVSQAPWLDGQRTRPPCAVSSSMRVSTGCATPGNSTASTASSQRSGQRHHARQPRKAARRPAGDATCSAARAGSGGRCCVWRRGRVKKRCRVAYLAISLTLERGSRSRDRRRRHGILAVVARLGGAR